MVGKQTMSTACDLKREQKQGYMSIWISENLIVLV